MPAQIGRATRPETPDGSYAAERDTEENPDSSRESQEDSGEAGGRRELFLTPSSEKLGVRVTYLQGIKQFELSKDFFTVDQVVLDIERRFKNTAFESRHFDFGDGIVLIDVPAADDIERVIRAAMIKAGNELTKDNLFVLQELTKTGRQKNFDSTWLESREDFNRDYIRQLAPFKYLYAVNPSLFRTPQDLVIANHEPERLFLFRLIENSKFVSSWVKSPDRDFYSLDYEFWKGGKDRVRRSFNPDFFIRISLSEYLNQLLVHQSTPVLDRLGQLQDRGIEELVFVVEVKSDDDASEETRAKGIFGEEHFQSINRRLRIANPIDLQVPFRNSPNPLYRSRNACACKRDKGPQHSLDCYSSSR